MDCQSSTRSHLYRCHTPNATINAAGDRSVWMGSSVKWEMMEWEIRRVLHGWSIWGYLCSRTSISDSAVDGRFDGEPQERGNCTGGRDGEEGGKEVKRLNGLSWGDGSADKDILSTKHRSWSTRMMSTIGVWKAFGSDVSTDQNLRFLESLFVIDRLWQICKSPGFWFPIFGHFWK